MPLLTIDDMLGGNPVEVADLLKQASSLSQQFDEYLRGSSRGEEHRAPGIHASEVTGCERRIVYSLLDYPRSGGSTDNVWRKRFMMGTAVHEMLQKEMHKWAVRTGHVITFEDEIAISPRLQQMAVKWNIYSHCDGRFTVRNTWDGPAIYRSLLEIKTMSPAEFKDLKAPKEEHIGQAHVYMACLDVPMIWLLYWNKGNQNTTGTDNPNFLIKFNPRKWKELEARFERVHQAAALERLPDREESIRCEFCAFSQHCQPSILDKVWGAPAQPRKWAL
jgi:CRISPR/Cas system-associated exonuclease Cas4 (RecB family)